MSGDYDLKVFGIGDGDGDEQPVVQPVARKRRTRTAGAVVRRVALNVVHFLTQARPMKNAAEEKSVQHADEIELQLAQAEQVISSGQGDVLAALEEREALKLQLVAARITKEKADSVAYRAEIVKKSAPYQKRLAECVAQIGEMFPRLQYEIMELARLETESYTVPDPQFDKCGVPYGFAAKLATALREASAGVQWDWGFVGRPGYKNDPPRAIGVTVIKVKTPVLGPPEGYTGAWVRGLGPVDLDGNPLK